MSTETKSTNIGDIRAIGVKALSEVLKIEKNIKIIEKNIHKATTKSQDCTDKYKEDYNRILYQTIGDIIQKVTLKNIIENIKLNIIGWNHIIFKDIKNRIDEADDFIINPFEVEEGVTKCNKCGSERVFTYQKQTRGADEPMSTFAKCVKCKAQWVYSG